jgi:DNA-binding transcriptional LysR family regulator
MKAQIGNLDTADALEKVPLILSERAPIGWTEWFRAKNFRRTLNRGLYFDRGYLALQAAAQGLGVTLESTVFAEPYLRRGDLVRLFEPSFGDMVISAHTLVYPPIYKDVRKVELFRDWIVGEAKTPDALRNASDQFFEWVRPEMAAEPVVDTGRAAVKSEAVRTIVMPKLDAPAAAVM